LRALGTHHWQHVDLVLSGINLGLNLGNSCWHSGTLAAAKQAALLGVRGIAFSTSVITELNAKTATATVSAKSYADWLLAKWELNQKGVTAVRPSLL
jgi:5'/3'-nucleotidase SurE